MDILMVAAELAPYAVGGPAAEVVASLSRALVQLGHHVTVALPRALGFEESGVMVARRLTPLTLADGSHVTLYDGQLPSGVRVVLFESPDLPARSGVFEEAGEAYSDLTVRFGALCRAAAALATQRAAQGEGFDVIHLHDWPSAAVSVLTELPTLLTIYDPANQGSCSLTELGHYGIGDDKAIRSRFRHGQRGNLLKGGMLSAHVVTTVSPGLAESALSEDLSGAMRAALNAAGVEIIGVNPGIDYAVFNPATDASLPTRFDAESLETKASCKNAVLRELELELDPEDPLLVFAGTLTKDSGADLLAPIASKLCRSPLRLVVVGEGSASLVKQLGSARVRALTNYRFLNKEHGELQRRMLAAADIALCPHRSDWLGTSIRAAQRYGAVPVALATPISRDCIVDCDPELSSGTGFLFEEPTSDALLGAVGRALGACRSAGWGKLRRRLLRLDQGWERAARRYAQLYASVAR